MRDTKPSQAMKDLAAPDAREVLDAIDAAWPAFTRSSLLSPEALPYRKQAIAAFPCAMWVVVQTAHSTRSRVDRLAAEQVIAAIDQAQPLIPVLAAFLRTTNAVIRKTVTWPLVRVKGITSRRRASRFMHCLAMIHALPDEARDAWPLLQDWLPVIETITRRGGPSRIELLNQVFGLLRELQYEPPAIYADVFALYRKLLGAAALRDCIDHSRMCNARLVLRHACFRRSRGSGQGISDLLDDRPFEPPVRQKLANGWTATELREWAQLRREGVQMRNCIANYAPDIRSGFVQVFSLCGKDGNERITALFSPRLGDSADGECTQVDARGPRNGPISLRACAAVLELAETLGSPTIRIAFGPA